MSQTEFASSFGISVSTLRHWERGDCTPQGSALVLLKVVAKEPKAVLNALVGKSANKNQSSFLYSPSITLVGFSLVCCCPGTDVAAFSKPLSIIY